MWVLKVGTLALYASCQIGSGLTLTLIVAYYISFSFCYPNKIMTEIANIPVAMPAKNIKGSIQFTTLSPISFS
jgi:hypothetical protein